MSKRRPGYHDALEGWLEAAEQEGWRTARAYGDDFDAEGKSIVQVVKETTEAFVARGIRLTKADRSALIAKFHSGHEKGLKANREDADDGDPYASDRAVWNKSNGRSPDPYADVLPSDVAKRVLLAGTIYLVEPTKHGYVLTGPRGATYHAVRNVHRPEWLGVVGHYGRTPRQFSRGLTDRNGHLEVL